MAIWLSIEFLLLLCFTPSSSLSTSSPSNVRIKPVKRVAIVGAGIAGLSLAHALQNSPSLSNGSTEGFEVSVFDNRKSLDYTAGSGVQLNGGMAVLGKINPEIQQTVIEAAVPVSELQGRNKSWMNDSTDKLWDFSIQTLIENAGGSTREELIVDGKVLWYAIMRGALQETLLNCLPKNKSLQVEFGKMVTGIRSEEGSAVCEFSDGSVSGPFDLIVGCDGIKSAVKEYVEKGKISDDASKREGSAAALYSGIRIGYAVQDTEEDDEVPQSLAFQQVFADGAYVFNGVFGNGPDRPPCKCVFVTSLDNDYNGPFKRNKSEDISAAAENSDWSQDQKKPKQEARNLMLERLARCNMPDEEISPIIANADRFFELGVYFHNPLSFSGWSKAVPSSEGSFAVLCGDAAHAMPPFLGQGANQAIQDAYSLAQKIYTFNAQLQNARVPYEEEDEDRPNLKALLKEYEDARWKPTTSITAKAAILGYLETGGRDGFYAKFRDLFFKVLAALGIPSRVLMDAATPKV